MDEIRKVMERDRFCTELVGMELVEVTPGKASVKMLIRPEHLNGLGSVQGGALFTMADFALAAAANSHGTAAVSINASISYFKAISEGELLAEAVEESLNAKIATYSVRITHGQTLVALMQATVYRKKQLLSELFPAGDRS